MRDVETSRRRLAGRGPYPTGGADPGGDAGLRRLLLITSSSRMIATMTARPTPIQGQSDEDELPEEDPDPGLEPLAFTTMEAVAEAF